MYIRSQYCIEHFIYHPIRDTSKNSKLKIQADLFLVTNILLNRNDIRPTHFPSKSTLTLKSKNVQSMLITKDIKKICERSN